MVWPAVIAAVASLAGAAHSNREKKKEAERNRQFQAQMSNTSYQRGIADMQAAGLNPMLAYSQGGASTPAGGQAAPPENVLGSAVSSALQGMQMVQGVQQIAQSDAQTELLQAQARKTTVETLTNEIHTAKALADLNLTKTDNLKREEEVLTERYRALSGQMAYRASMDKDELKDTGFAADVRKRKADAALSELEIPEKKSTAQFFESIGQGQPWLRMLMEVLKFGRGK